MLKSEFIAEITAPRAPAPKPEPKKAHKPEPQKGLTAEEFTPAVKRGKAQPKEIPVDEMPERLKKAIELAADRPAPDDEA